MTRRRIRGAMLAALLAISIPTFVIGPLLILVFALKLRWLPVGGWGGVACLVLPGAYAGRAVRGLHRPPDAHEHAGGAWAGFHPHGAGQGPAGAPRIVYKHALKVAILPVVSFLGPLAANLLTGSIVVESIFNIPGAGGFFVNSIQNRDGFLLGGVVIVYCALLVVMNLVVDLVYTALDRRIQLYE